MSEKITLKSLIESVKERKLSKDQLEAYRLDLEVLTAMMHLENSELEKKESLFLSQVEGSAVAASRKWDITHDGQRRIEIKNYIRSATVMLSSLKSRLFSVY